MFVNFVQAITVQTITNRSEMILADTEEIQLSEGDFKGNIQENQRRQFVNTCYLNLMKMNRGANSLYSLEWSLIDTIDIWTTALQVEYKDSHFLMDTCATFLYLQEKLISN